MSFLNKAEELKYIRRYKNEKNTTRKRKIKDRIIKENLKFAWKCGLEHYWNRNHLYRQTSLTIDDAKSSAVFGMMKALEKFEPNRQVKFNTFAKHSIRKQLQKDLFSELSFYNHHKFNREPGIFFAQESKFLEIVNLLSISKKEKALIIDRFLRKKTYEEIAKKYDIHFNTARKQVMKILEKLRKRLEKEKFTTKIKV